MPDRYNETTGWDWFSIILLSIMIGILLGILVPK